MLEIHYFPTPNGHKITMFCEEAGLDYAIVPVNIIEGHQHQESFLKISPNNKIPALVDPEGPNGRLAVFESGAILQYLAEKTGKFLPRDGAQRYDTLQWLHWQVANLGPMAGQNHHFNRYAPEKIPYAIKRYEDETRRLYGVLERQLNGRTFMTGDQYTIADMATYPWIAAHEHQNIDLQSYPNVKRWHDEISQKPSTKRAYAHAEKFDLSAIKSEQARKNLFGQK